MVEKFLESEIGKKIVGNENEADFNTFMMENIKLYKYKINVKNEKEYEVDKVLGKHIISHLQTFFNHSTKNRTIKNRGNKKNKTLKRIV
jgi:hypothetical protein